MNEEEKAYNELANKFLDSIAEYAERLTPQHVVILLLDLGCTLALDCMHNEEDGREFIQDIVKEVYLNWKKDGNEQ